MSNKILDKVGQEIKVGDVIAYAIQVCDSPNLRIGQVVRLKSWSDTRFNGETYTCYRITVQGTDYGWRSAPDHVLLSKLSTLQFPSRVVVLDPAKVDEKFMKLFDV